MKAPEEKRIAFTFMAEPSLHSELRWTARMEFPPGASADTMLPISVTDGDGNQVESATFEFAGKNLKVRNGHAEISYADFIKGKHSVPLWLHRSGVPPVAGGLTFA